MKVGGIGIGSGGSGISGGMLSSSSIGRCAPTFLRLWLVLADLCCVVVVMVAAVVAAVRLLLADGLTGGPN